MTFKVTQGHQYWCHGIFHTSIAPRGNKYKWMSNWTWVKNEQELKNRKYIGNAESCRLRCTSLRAAVTDDCSGLSCLFAISPPFPLSPFYISVLFVCDIYSVASASTSAECAKETEAMYSQIEPTVQLSAEVWQTSNCWRSHVCIRH